MSSKVHTNIELDLDLINEAMEIFGLRSRRELIQYALEELVRRKKQQQLLTLEGGATWQGDLDDMRKTR